MPTRSRSGSESSTTSVDQDRLAHLERLLASQLYSTAAPPATSLDPPPSGPVPEPPEPVEEDVSVSFRLFSTSKTPTRVTIREKSTPPPVHLKDPRIRAVEDEDPSIVKQRKREIKSIVVTGESIREQSKQSFHAPNYRLTTRRISSLPHAPPTSTREPLPLPSLAYLNSSLPSPLNSLSPSSVPSTSETGGPLEPNEHLITKGPYTLGKLGTGIKRRLPIVLSEGVKERKVVLKVVPILEEEKDSRVVVREKERKRVLKEVEKERKKRTKAWKLKVQHGEIEVGKGVDQKKKKRKGRLSKERRERAKKRERAKATDAAKA
ncbi:hypothetical protein JCM16303_000528 [Sporobolomyces ruberrimus]